MGPLRYVVERGLSYPTLPCSWAVTDRIVFLVIEDATYYQDSSHVNGRPRPRQYMATMKAKVQQPIDEDTPANDSESSGRPETHLRLSRGVDTNNLQVNGGCDTHDNGKNETSQHDGSTCNDSGGSGTVDSRKRMRAKEQKQMNPGMPFERRIETHSVSGDLEQDCIKLKDTDLDSGGASFSLAAVKGNQNINLQAGRSIDSVGQDWGECTVVISSVSANLDQIFANLQTQTPIRGVSRRQSLRMVNIRSRRALVARWGSPRTTVSARSMCDSAICFS